VWTVASVSIYHDAADTFIGQNQTKSQLYMANLAPGGNTVTGPPNVDVWMSVFDSFAEWQVLVVSSCGVFPENLFENPVVLDQDKLGEAKNMEAMAILGNRRGRSCVPPLRKAERRAYRKQPARGVLRATTQCMFCSNIPANAVHRSEPHHLVAAKVSAPWMPCEGGSNSFGEDKMPHTTAQYG